MHELFETIKPDPLTEANDLELREAYSTLLETIKRLTTPSRENALAVTHLQTSCLFAVRSLHGRR